MNHFPELDWLLRQGQLGCHDDKETKPHDVSCPVSSECCRCDVLRVTEPGSGDPGPGAMSGHGRPPHSRGTRTIKKAGSFRCEE